MTIQRSGVRRNATLNAPIYTRRREGKCPGIQLYQVLLPLPPPDAGTLDSEASTSDISRYEVFVPTTGFGPEGLPFR